MITGFWLNVGCVAICGQVAAAQVMSVGNPQRHPHEDCSGRVEPGFVNELMVELERKDQVAVGVLVSQEQNRLGACNGYPEWRLEPARVEMDVAEPSYAEVLASWQAHYGVLVDGARTECASYGRAVPRMMLGAMLAQQGGAKIDSVKVGQAVVVASGQQYSEAAAGDERLTHLGMFGYPLFEMGGCPPLEGLVAERAILIRELFPQFTARYQEGVFADQLFAVADYDGLGAWPDDGGGAYDHGFSAAMMALATTHENPAVAQIAYDSLLLAAEWSMHEPAVPNTNYTAKNIWVLAMGYRLSGDVAYRDAMIEKISLTVIPSMLTDFEAPFGEVDGVDGVRFSDLHPVARTPGRCFDGHNVQPWYHSINAWALVASYAALRDRGDDELAKWIEAYAVAAVDSLADEFLRLGGPSPKTKGPALGDVPIALLMGLIEMPDASQASRSAWKDAAWGLWNTGLYSIPDETRAFAAGMYVLLASKGN